MTEGEIHITNLAGGRGRRLYYYQGNFFHPVDLFGAEAGQVRGGINRFMKANRAMVDADRADPNYKTLPQLFDEQLAEFDREQKCQTSTSSPTN